MAPAEARWHCLPDTGRIFSARTHGSLFIVQRVVAVFLLFRHEGKFGVAFDEGGVEGGELVASLILACADQQFVGQVCTATQGTDSLSNSSFVFKPKVSDKNICVESDHRGDFRNLFAAPDWTAA